jgi:hypothetical protein
MLEAAERAGVALGVKVQRKNALDVALDRWVEDLADRESRLRASADFVLVLMGSTPLKNCGRRDPRGANSVWTGKLGMGDKLAD